MTVFALDGPALAQVVWTSLLAGIGLCTLFATAIFAFARAGEARRASRRGPQLGYGLLGSIALFVCLVAVGFGVRAIA